MFIPLLVILPFVVVYHYHPNKDKKILFLRNKNSISYLWMFFVNSWGLLLIAVRIAVGPTKCGVNCNIELTLIIRM
jgi:hypothetical protein